MTVDAATFRELQESAGADFVDELVDTFLQEAPSMLAELRQAWEDGAADRFRRAAHSLKSNGLTFGAIEFAALAKELELEELPNDPAPLEALEVSYQRAAAALKEMPRG
jgi:HPt (histidine-containing phosphotransfer) domain-containing protein